MDLPAIGVTGTEGAAAGACATTHAVGVSFETAATPIAVHIATSATAQVDRFILDSPVDVRGSLK